MRKRIAYITAPWGPNEAENTERAAEYCREIYEEGYLPICPILFLPLFIHEEIPQEHKDAIDMAQEMLRRAHVLVVCTDKRTETMKEDIAIAERLNITTTTKEGLKDVKQPRRTNHAR